MASYSIAQAKDKLTSLINAAEAGETVTITRRGKPVAVVKPVEDKIICRPETIDWITAQTADIPPVDVDAVTVLNELREKPESWRK